MKGWCMLALALLLSASVGITGSGVAAEETSQAEVEPEYSFGTVKQVGQDQIVLSEFDYDTGEEKEVNYSIDPKVQINGVASLSEVAAGDEVDVDYVIKDGKNVAVVLSIAKPLEAEQQG